MAEITFDISFDLMEILKNPMIFMGNEKHFTGFLMLEWLLLPGFVKTIIVLEKIMVYFVIKQSMDFKKCNLKWNTDDEISFNFIPLYINLVFIYNLSN